MPVAATHLTTNDQEAPLGVGGRIRLSWTASSPWTTAEIEVSAESGELVWASGRVPGGLPVLDFDTAVLDSRTGYLWKVRLRDGSSDSPWSAPARFETGVLVSSDWRAEWIARPVPLSNRIIRSIDHDRTDWVEPGDTLGQSFTAFGAFSALTVDLTAQRGETVEALLSLTDQSGRVVAQRTLAPVQFPGDRFAHWLDLETLAPAGDYFVTVEPRVGRLGWRTLTAGDDSAASESGVLPAPVLGDAVRNGAVTTGTRALGVETVPAPDPIFRRRVTIGEHARFARIAVAAQGYARVSINGSPITDIVLDPAPTAVTERILARTYDITDRLMVGENVVEIEVGRGYVGTRGASTWSWNLAPHHQEPALLAELWWSDGVHQHFAGTGDQWSTQASPIVFDSLYGGETIDFSTDRGDWEPSLELRRPDAIVLPALLPPVRPHAELAPTSTTSLRPGVSVHDFGEVTAGWVRLEVLASPHDQVSVEYAEQADEAGDIAFENVLAAGRAQVDHFVLGDEAAAGAVSLEPRFTYKGFRFIRVTMSATAQLVRVAAVPVHLDVTSTGRFTSSSPLLNWLDDATSRSVLNNLHGIPTDTPAYEKNGWTADAHLIAETALHHFDLRTFFAKWLDDHADAQLEDGTVPQIVPTPGWGLAADPAWAASYPLTLWSTYQEYGDRTLLADHVDNVLRYLLRLIETVAHTGWLWRDHSWGDWLAPGHHFAPEGPTPTASLMLLKSIQVGRQICNVVARPEEEQRLAVAETQIAAAYNNTYFNNSSGVYESAEVGYRQTMNVLPLVLDIVPQNDRPSVEAGLIGDIEGRTNGHLDVGAIGTKYLLPALTQAGRADLALRVATQLDRPGWGLWKEVGSKTLWESWDANVRSHDHYFLGSIGQWMHETVGGLARTSSAWRACILRPRLIATVEYAAVSHMTPFGEVAFEWSSVDFGVQARVQIPAGVEVLFDTQHLGAGTLYAVGALPQGSGRWSLSSATQVVEWRAAEALARV